MYQFAGLPWYEVLTGKVDGIVGPKATAPQYAVRVCVRSSYTVAARVQSTGPRMRVPQPRIWTRVSRRAVTNRSARFNETA